MIHHLLAPSLLTVHSRNSSHYTQLIIGNQHRPGFKKFFDRSSILLFSCASDRRGIKCISLFLFLIKTFSLLLCFNFLVLFSSSMIHVVIYSRMCFATHSSASSFTSWSSSFQLSSSTKRRNNIYKHKIYFGYLNSELWNVKRSRVSFFNFPDGTDSSRRSVRTGRAAKAENNSIFWLYKLSNLSVKNTFTSERTSCMSNQISTARNVNFDRLLATIYWLDYMHKMFMTGSSSGIRRKLW